MLSRWTRGERPLLQKIGEVSEPVSFELRTCMADEALACVAECGGWGGRDGGGRLALTQTAIGLIGAELSSSIKAGGEGMTMSLQVEAGARQYP